MSGEDSPLFLHSSPLPHLTSSPDDEVPVLVQEAQEVEALEPAFDSFLASHDDAFFDVFDRQVDLIRSRSQAFEDGHVTVYDKALLVLTQNGNSLNNPAAIRFYCREYLNIEIGTREATQEWTAKLQQTTQVPGDLRQELAAGKTSLAQKDAGEKRARLLPVDPNLRKDMEPRLAVLWTVYETARAEYLAVIDKDDNEQTAKRAKFLRDTAENILLYLENRVADPLMIAELEGTFNHAKNTAVCLSGGKKRKFDPSEMNKVKGTPLGPSLPFRKDKYRLSGGRPDAGAYKHHQHRQLHPDVSSGYAGGGGGSEMMTRSYGWASSDLPPSGHGHPRRIRYFNTNPYQDLDVPPLGYPSAPAAPSRDYQRSYDHVEGEYGSGLGPYNAAVSSVLPTRGMSGSRTRIPFDERGSPAVSEYQENIKHERENSPTVATASRLPRITTEEQDEDDTTTSTEHTPATEAVVVSARGRPRSIEKEGKGGGGGGWGGYSDIDRGAYSRNRDQDREHQHDHPDDHDHEQMDDRGRPKNPLLGRGDSSAHYSNYGGNRLVDSYVPARNGSLGPGHGRVRGRSQSHRRRVP
ncbi:hypothetical protein AYL99_02207 [Fonsecaea erecta]|uniref:Uncharacterized protein n=1 Tax=Fonsecaea erecta TaxID=1367422 RepID=A0A178ZT42_9EURO|nr:hypothetical protein AYL99_02207 [Fonsecaea erecta]OAP62980.1 hypothetical protein AYL99_02207 [Fonsecaea erecta]